MDDVLALSLPDGLTARRSDSVRLERLWQAKRQVCPATHAHEVGVGLEVAALAGFLGWDRSTVTDFSHCAMFHDVGKVHTPREILWKPGRLTDGEMAVMKRHASNGAGMLSRFEGVIGEIGVQMANFHHERPDGLGYHGLRGRDIPVFARICAVADVYEAMTSIHRSYKAAFSVGEALLMMVREAEPGKFGRDQFDLPTLHAFVRLKLGAERDRLSIEELDVLKDFERNNGVSRRADIAAFRVGLAAFERSLGKGPLGDARMALSLASAADRDPDLAVILRQSAVAGVVERLCAAEGRRGPDPTTAPAVRALSR